jgi:hypothetical protein
VTGQVQQSVHLGDGHPLRAVGDLDDLVTRLDRALDEHPEVEAGPVMLHEQRRYPRVVHPDTHPVAGDARLSHLEQRLADPVSIPDAHLVVRQAVDGEVLTELAVREIVASQEFLPVPVGAELVHEDCAVLAAVTAEVPLPVTLDVEAPHHDRPAHRRLPHTRVHGAAPPRHVLGHADAHGPQRSHLRIVQQSRVGRKQAAGASLGIGVRSVSELRGGLECRPRRRSGRPGTLRCCACFGAPRVRLDCDEGQRPP